MKNERLIRIVASFVLTIGITAGVVYAGFNYENIKKYVIGGGIKKAVENGYVENVIMDDIKQETSIIDKEKNVVDNVSVDFKVDDFTMDDTNLCMNFTFKFSENIKDYIDFNMIHKFILKDLIILDEENVTIFEEGYGLNTVKTRVDENENVIEIMYNMFGYNKYPNSKKLFLKFSMIELSEYNASRNLLEEKVIILNGEWEKELDVPEKIYNRTSQGYKIINCSNNNIKVHTAVVTETGFEFGAIIENCKNYYSENLISNSVSRMGEIYIKINELSSNDKNEKEKLAKEYYELENKLHVINTDRIDFANNNVRINTTYVLDSNGNKYEFDETPGKTQKYNFIDDNTYDFTIPFQMTKFSATDNIKVILDYRGEIVTIELEKVK